MYDGQRKACEDDPTDCRNDWNIYVGVRVLEHMKQEQAGQEKADVQPPQGAETRTAVFYSEVNIRKDAPDCDCSEGD